MTQPIGNQNETPQASTRQLSRKEPNRIPSSISQRDIRSQLQTHRRTNSDNSRFRIGSIHETQWSPVVILGDTHFPWAHQKALQKAYAVIKATQPKYVIQIGDLYDLYSFSRFPRSQNVITPDQEVKVGRDTAVAMWRTVQRLAPKARCFQLWGNHDVRALKRTFERSPELENFVAEKMRTLMSFDGVQLVDTASTELVIEGIHYIHGYMPNGAHVNDTRVNTVAGDSHRGGLFPIGYEGQIVWELRVGWLGDRSAPVFSYASRKRAHRTTLGVGVVDKLGPRFIPFSERT